MKQEIKNPKPTLQEFGEFRLINEVILPTFRNGAVHGDDCSFVPIDKEGTYLALTADAAPRPLIWELGHQSFFTWGWYSVLINASDLAAAGADPVSFLSSVKR